MNEGQPISDDEGWALLDQISGDLTTEGRVLFADDPALGLGSVVTALDDAGEPLTDETTEQLPVALFEPRRAMVMRDPTGKTPPKESHTEAALLLGMQRIPYGTYNLTALDQWELRRTRNGLALHDSRGDLFAAAELAPDPQWVSAATSQRWVVVLHGIRLGVRTPPGTPPEQYTAADRRAEVTESRKMGLVTGGLVRWHG